MFCQLSVSSRFVLNKYVCFNVVLHISFVFKNDNMKAAEVAAYFKRFEDAERMYLDMDRRYVRLSVWFSCVYLLALCMWDFLGICKFLEG